MLLPVLAAAKARALQTQCTNNEKQLCNAYLIYVNDNNDRCPCVNDSRTKGVGWLFNSTVSALPVSSGGGLTWTGPQSGAFWSELYGNTGPVSTTAVSAGGSYTYYTVPNQWKLFFCPVDLYYTQKNPKAYAQRAILFSSYVMNVVIDDYEQNSSTAPNSGQNFSYKNTQFKPDDVLFWEPIQTNSANFNDGSSEPDSTQGIGTQHGGEGSTVGLFCGAVQFMRYQAWLSLAKQNPGPPSPLITRNSLWCTPNKIPTGY